MGIRIKITVRDLSRKLVQSKNKLEKEAADYEKKVQELKKKDRDRYLETFSEWMKRVRAKLETDLKLSDEEIYKRFEKNRRRTYDYDIFQFGVPPEFQSTKLPEHPKNRLARVKSSLEMLELATEDVLSMTTDKLEAILRGDP